MIFNVIASSTSYSRPEYAIHHGINRCTICHISPSGGSERNLNGKYYGSRNFSPSPYSRQDLVSLDFRALYFAPENRPETNGGLAWMAGIVSLNLPLSQEDDKKEKRLVFGHNIGGFSAAQPRNLYLRWKNYGENEYHFYPQYVLFGRFHAPFGLLTDEHRTYTRILTRNTWNDFEMGVLASGDISPEVHYDAALVNGEKTSGTSLGKDRALIWGQIINFRLQPFQGPILIGMSGSYHRRIKKEESPYAATIYGVLSLTRWSNGKINGSLSMEYTQAHFWNSENVGIAGLLQDPNGVYLNTVSKSESSALLLQTTWDLNLQWSFLYRYEQLRLDRHFPADTFDRHGLGFRHFFDSNMILNTRIEFANARQPTQHSSSGKASIDGGWIVLQIGI